MNPKSSQIDLFSTKIITSTFHSHDFLDLCNQANQEKIKILEISHEKSAPALWTVSYINLNSDLQPPNQPPAPSSPHPNPQPELFPISNRQKNFPD